MSMMEELCRLLEECAHIIRKQAELLAMHGIQTEDGEIEAARSRVIGEINGNYCVCCGQPIPEGRQVCQRCEEEAYHVK
ncbi:MAG: hypothetical protein J6K73_05325 [Clostridia bacterium]|nr:hypothetical protein [Clostridia bacterium]